MTVDTMKEILEIKRAVALEHAVELAANGQDNKLDLQEANGLALTLEVFNKRRLPLSILQVIQAFCHYELCTADRVLSDASLPQHLRMVTEQLIETFNEVMRRTADMLGCIHND